VTTQHKGKLLKDKPLEGEILKDEVDGKLIEDKVEGEPLWKDKERLDEEEYEEKKLNEKS